MGKVLDLLQYKAYFTWEMAKEFAWFPEGIIGLFFVVYNLSNCGLAMFHSDVTNRQYCMSFECKSTRLKREF